MTWANSTTGYDGTAYTRKPRPRSTTPMITDSFRLTVSAMTPVGISQVVTVISSTVPTSASWSAFNSRSVMRNTIVTVADVWNASHVQNWYPSHTRSARMRVSLIYTATRWTKTCW